MKDSTYSEVIAVSLVAAPFLIGMNIISFPFWIASIWDREIGEFMLEFTKMYMPWRWM